MEKRLLSEDADCRCRDDTLVVSKLSVGRNEEWSGGEGGADEEGSRHGRNDPWFMSGGPFFDRIGADNFPPDPESPPKNDSALAHPSLSTRPRFAV